jgi:hypothetical protein
LTFLLHFFCQEKKWKNPTAIGLSLPPPSFVPTKKLKPMELQELTTTELEIAPSATSSQHDFDFLEGRWAVYNRKLKSRLDGCTDWSEFESVLHMRKTLLGLGNVENYYATFEGKPFEGQAIRLFNPKTKCWTIHWMDSNNSVMDQHPVTGSFENGIGKFYARDVFKGRPILVIYQWDASKPERPIWSQAFSEDDGQTWEWNWEMYLTRID